MGIVAVFRSVSVRVRLALLLVLAVLGFAGTTFLLAGSLERLAEGSRTIYASGVRGLAAASGLLEAVEEVSILGLRGAAEGVMGPDKVASIRENMDRVGKLAEACRGTLRDEAGRAEFERAETARRARAEAIGKTIALGGRSATPEEVRSTVGEARESASAFLSALKVLADHAEAVAGRLNEANDREAARQRGIAYALLGGGVLLLALFGALVAASIVIPVRRFVDFAERTTEALDLEEGYPIRSRDEVSHMARAYLTLRARVREALLEVREAQEETLRTAETLSAAAQQANTSVEEVGAGVREAAQDISSLGSLTENVNASMEEVAAGAQTAAQRAAHMAEQVGSAESAGEEGRGAVAEALRSIETVARESRASADRVKELSDRARQIQGFVSQIGGIADQTNLLALNAAIEAARAGEAGRGFAVVAEEVRKLAEESNGAAHRIEEISRSIVQDLGGAVESVEGNARTALAVRERAGAVVTAIDRIHEALKNIAGASQEVAAVAEEQAASGEEITASVQNMTDETRTLVRRTEQTGRRMGEVAGAAESVAEGAVRLTELGRRLAGAVDRFRLGSRAGAPGLRGPAASAGPAALGAGR